MARTPIVVVLISLAAASHPALAQDLLDDVITLSPLTLNVSRYARLPTSSNNVENTTTQQIISMTTRPDDNALYVSSQNGRVHRVVDNGNGTGATSLWFDVNNEIDVQGSNSFHGGLRSIAFHPDFGNANKPGYGKFYASVMVDGDATADTTYLGNSTGPSSRDSLIAEWTLDRTNGQIAGFRELFRVRNPEFDHPLKQATFNPTSVPGDEDYGLLYIAHGDGSRFGTGAGTGQVADDALGKILRIDPLDPDGDGPLRYATPGNWFANDGNNSTLAEIYSMGHRNPHHLTFARDATGQSHLLVAEVGQDNIEEVNVSVNGGNFGWNERTGTFVYKDTTQLPPSANGYGFVDPLPADDAQLNDYIYPALQIDHDDTTGTGTDGARRIGIAGGFVSTSSSQPGLGGRYFFGDFAEKNTNLPESSGGQIYSVRIEDLLSQHTQLADNETPDDLTWIDDFDRHQFLFNGAVYDDFVDLLAANGTSGSRADFRFGQGPQGEFFLSSKRNGTIYRIDNVFSESPWPVPAGDFDSDADFDCNDIDVLVAAIAANSIDAMFDLNGDGNVNAGDITTWLATAGANNLPSGGAYLHGDANLDGVVDTSDFNIWNANKFTNIAAWCSGDFNADGFIDTSDFNLWNGNKFQSSLIVVPEPEFAPMLFLALAVFLRFTKRDPTSQRAKAVH